MRFGLWNVSEFDFLMPMDFSYPALDGKQGLPVKSFNLGDGFKD
jgi:hypothetical protein